MSDFASRLAAARSRAGLSQSELARRVGMRPQSIQAMECGRAKTTRRLCELARVLVVNPNWLSGVNAADEVDAPVARLVRLLIDRQVTIDQANRIYDILDEKP